MIRDALGYLFVFVLFMLVIFGIVIACIQLDRHYSGPEPVSEYQICLQAGGSYAQKDNGVVFTCTLPK